MSKALRDNIEEIDYEEIKKLHPNLPDTLPDYYSAGYKDALALFQQEKDLAVREALKSLLVEHDQVCGATFQDNPRDDCTLRQQIFDKLGEDL